MRKFRILAVAAVMVTALLWPGAAQATAPCSGVGELIAGGTQRWNGCVYASAGLRGRTHPGNGYVYGTEVVRIVYPFGTKVYIDCYLDGVTVTGPNGPTTIWDAVGTYQTPGGPVLTFADGGGVFVVSSDAWIYTGSNNPVVPHC
jgi:hypothetical protein